MNDRPLTTLEAVCRVRSHLWAIAGLAAQRVRWGRLSEVCESRELDAVTDACEVRHAVLVYPHEDER